eukprot:jgi/Bigna1/72451/fgenesh1_pg.20_\
MHITVPKDTDQREENEMLKILEGKYIETVKSCWEEEVEDIIEPGSQIAKKEKKPPKIEVVRVCRTQPVDVSRVISDVGGKILVVYLEISSVHGSGIKAKEIMAHLGTHLDNQLDDRLSEYQPGVKSLQLKERSKTREGETISAVAAATAATAARSHCKDTKHNSNKDHYSSVNNPNDQSSTTSSSNNGTSSSSNYFPHRLPIVVAAEEIW